MLYYGFALVYNQVPFFLGSFNTDEEMYQEACSYLKSGEVSEIELIVSGPGDEFVTTHWFYDPTSQSGDYWTKVLTENADCVRKLAGKTLPKITGAIRVRDHLEEILGNTLH